MKSLLSVVLFSFISLHSLAQITDKETLKKLNEDWLHAIEKKDSAALGKILAHDFILIGPNGAAQKRKDNLLNVISPNIDVSAVHIDSVKVRMITPDVGILTAWTSFSMKSDGKTSAAKNCYQDVYLKRKNKWLAVSAHVTLLSIH